MSTSIVDDIVTAATQPQQATGDGGSVTMRSLTEQIEADRYRALREAAQHAHRGVYMTKLVPPGMVQ